jgi:hypothetical protein
MMLETGDLQQVLQRYLRLETTSAWFWLPNGVQFGRASSLVGIARQPLPWMASMFWAFKVQIRQCPVDYQM